MNLFDLEAKISIDSKDFEAGISSAQKSMSNYKADVMKLANEYKKSGMDMSAAMKKAYAEIDKSQYATADKAKDASGKFFDSWNDVGSKLGPALASAAKVGVAAMTAAAGAVTALTGTAVSNFAEYEQLVGGVDTLFKGSADTVKGYAENAYQTAGMSANEYMETVTGFSASLIQSLDGDTAAAAEKANRAITDMSDNANKMGTDIESIQNAYGGFAKGNFTMLDNLKLGYGGTKEEMQRLLDKAEELSGVEYDMSSYGDIVDAIHVVQEELDISGITAEEAAEAVASGAMTEEEAFQAMGTTAKEASTTIEGSVNATKAAWENLLTGLADGNANLGPLIDNLVSTASTAAKNIIPVVSQALTGAATLIQEMVPVIMQELPNFISDTLPTLVQSGVSIISAIVEGLAQNAGELVKAAADAVTALVDGITDAIPDVIDAIAVIVPEAVVALAEATPDLLESGLEMIEALADGIMDAIPTLIDALPAVVEAVAEAILEGIPMIIVAGVELLSSIAGDLPGIISRLVEKIPEIVTSLVDSIASHMPEITQAGFDLLTSLVTDLPSIIFEILLAVPEIVIAIIHALTENYPKMFEAGFNFIMSLFKKLPEIYIESQRKTQELTDKLAQWIKDAVPKMIEAGRNLIMGIWNGINDKVAWLKSQVSGVVDKIKSWFEGPAGFDEHSPSKWAKRVFEYVMEGAAQGIQSKTPFLENATLKTVDLVKKSLADVGTGADETATKITEMVATLEKGAEELDYEGRLGLVDAIVQSTDPSKGMNTIIDAYKNVDQMAKDLTESLKAASQEYADFEAKVEESKRKAIESLEKDKKKVIDEMMADRAELTEEIFGQYGLFDTFDSGAAEAKEAAAKEAAEKEKERVKAQAARLKEATDQVFGQYGLFDSTFKRQTINGGLESIKTATEKVFGQYGLFDATFKRQTINSKLESIKAAADQVFGQYDIFAESFESTKAREKAEASMTEIRAAADEIFGQYGLFDSAKFERKGVTGYGLIRNLEGQVKAVDKFYSNLDKLKEKGASESLVKSIRDMGVGASEELDALVKMSGRNWEKYLALYQQKVDQAQEIGERSATEAGGITGQSLIDNLQGQLESTESFYNDLKELSERGADEALVDIIRRKGVSASGELDALLGLSDEKLQEYFDLFTAKSEQAERIGAENTERTESVTAGTLIQNLQDQVEATDEFYSNLEKLSGRGASEALVSMIREMGVGSAAELDTLVSMTDEELQQYFDLFIAKSEQAERIGAENAEKIESVTAGTLIQNLQDQIDSTDEFYSNLEKLSERGASEALVSMIRDMGVGATAELDTLVSMTDVELDKYLALYQEKADQAQRIAEALTPEEAEAESESEEDEEKVVTGQSLIDSLKQQNKYITDFYSNIQTLASRGAGEELVDMIAEMGVGASEQLEALVNMTDEELAEYLALFDERGTLATRFADMQMGFDPDDPEKNFEAGVKSVEEYFKGAGEDIGEAFDKAFSESAISGIPDMIDGVSGAVEAAVAQANENVHSIFDEDMNPQEGVNVLQAAHKFARVTLSKHFFQFTPFADPSFVMPTYEGPHPLSYYYDKTPNAPQQPQEINLVLPTGEKMAEYIFKPLTDFASAHGTPILNPQT